MANKTGSIWVFREAKAVTPAKKFFLGVFIFAGFLAIIRLANWWFREVHIGNLVLFLLLSFFFWYGLVRLILVWINYMAISKPAKIGASSVKKVAIFTTSSPGEPLGMFDKTLEACSKIKYPHTTYLLDDTQDAEYRQIAEKHGAIWLNIVGFTGAKAGKINQALTLTSEDFILVLDPDHMPFSNFLDEVMPFFEDENVGFVQVAQAYYNQYRSFVAAAAAEQTYGFYGPTQMGLNGRNCAVAIGANCTFRRAALDSVGGHGIGLSEDLITSIRIHAAGWKSIYHPVIVSRGLVPEEFDSFCKQQLKWSRGVHEVLFAEVPRLFSKLSFWQKISYSAIGTYYLAGASTLFYILVPFFYLFFDLSPAKMNFVEFVSHGLPVAIISVFIYLYVQFWMCDRSTEKGLHWKGMVVKFACWPVFFMGLIWSIVLKEIPYIPTAKKAVAGKVSIFVLPMLFYIVSFISALVYTFVNRFYFKTEFELIATSEQTWGMLAFSSVSFLLCIVGVFAAFESKKMVSENTWEKIDSRLL